MSWGGNGSRNYDQSTTGDERRSDILKLILYDLNSAIAPHDNRITALQTAISEFDHDQDFKHDEELDLHADKILFQKLAFAFHVDRSSEEIAMICTALEMVYRASRPRVALSFAELRESILPIFVEMLGKPLHRRKQEALDAALREQAARQDTENLLYRKHGDAGSYRSGQSASHRTGSSGTHSSAPAKNTDDMSLRSSGIDDATYASYQSFNKAYKPQPDDASFRSDDEDILKKPSKYIDDNQSYLGYDDQSMADQSHNKGAYEPASSVDEYSQGDVYRYNDQYQSDDQSYQTFHHDGEDGDDGQALDRPYKTSGASENPSKHIDDGQSYSEYDDQSVATHSYKKGVYESASSADDGSQGNVYQGNHGYDDQSAEDQSHERGGYEPGSSVDDGAQGDVYQDNDQGYQPDDQTFASFHQGVEGGDYQPSDRTHLSTELPEDQTMRGQQRDHADDQGVQPNEQSYGDNGQDCLPDDEKHLELTGDRIDHTCEHDQHDVPPGDRVYETDELVEQRDSPSYATNDQSQEHGEGDSSQVDQTDKDELTNDGGESGNNERAEDATLDGSHVQYVDDHSVVIETNSTDDGYHNEEQSLQPTMSSSEQGKIGDEIGFGDHSFQSHSDTILQPSSYQRSFDKNAALAADHGDDASQTEGDGHVYSNNQDDNQDHVTGREAYNEFRQTDEMSQYSGDYSVHKPGEETYDVETVYSEDEDDQSRDPSLVSKVSATKTSGFVANREHSLRFARGSVGGLSTVAEDVDGESFPSYSSQSSMHKSKTFDASGYSRPSLQPYDGDETAHSSRNSLSTSESARVLKQRKMEGERQMSEQVAILEAELEFIRVEDTTNPVGVSRSLQVLRYFSRVLSAMVPMAHHPGLLDALVYQLERQVFGRHADQFNFYDDGEPRAEVDKEELASARVDAIATIVNLACAEDNKSKMASHPGLLDAITTVAQCDPSEEAREHAAIVLMNLAYDDENKELMVQHEHMLDTLVKLIQDYSPFTRRYASAALFTLACVVGNTEKMTVFCDGEILECLRRVLDDDPVDEARINAAEALFNMARNSTEETLQIMGDHPRLLATLAKAVLTDYSADARVFCARALEWMAVGIHFPMECHRLLLSALTVSAQWTKTSCIAEAMKTQATLAENRLPMAAHDGLLHAIANLALLESLTDTEVRKSAIATLEMISRAAKARQYMVKNELVMRALTKASFQRGDEEVYADDDQGTAVTPQLLKQAMRNLASEM
ncbi:HEAT repeat [Fragilaria crotonensis]|nr:HEAT repeat [Fragilaria crotonensis]